MEISGIDVALAALVLIILILVFAYARIRPRALAGYWSSQKTEAMYGIRPVSWRTFEVSTGSAAGGAVKGSVRGLRKISVAFPGEAAPRTGYVEFGSRRIIWGNGDLWTLQGIR